MDRDKDCGITKSRGFRDAFHQWFIFTHRTKSHMCFCHGRSTQVAYDHVFPNKVSDYELILLDHGPVEILRHGSIVCV